MPEFTEVSYFAGVDRIEDGRGAVVSDIDRDGDLDILIRSYDQPSLVLVNQGEGEEIGNWLHVELEGTRSNRDAIGARVEISVAGRDQFREVRTTAGYLSGCSPLCYFGLGDAEVVDELRVFWPSGEKTILRNVSANQRLQLVEGKNHPDELAEPEIRTAPHRRG